MCRIQKCKSVVAMVCLMLLLAGCGSDADTSLSTAASRYPVKPITIIVPFTSGGGVDLVARDLQKVAAKYITQPVIVVNTPGDGGMLAWNQLAGAEPDGYTLGVVDTGIIMEPLLSNDMRYHYLTALQPIAQAVAVPMVIAVKADSPWRTVNDLVAYAKQHPHAVKFGHSGLGSAPHIMGEMLAQTAGVSMSPTPFRGGAESLVALRNGQVQFMLASFATVNEDVRAGTVRVLAVSSAKRLTAPMFKDVPTLSEQGFPVVFDDWVDVAAPQQMPPEIIAKLNDIFGKIIADPEFAALMQQQGLVPAYADNGATVRRWMETNERLRVVLEQTGIADEVKAQKK